MTKYQETIKDVVYLCACAVDGAPLDTERVKQMDLAALYQAANRHQLTAIVAMSLESAGIKDSTFTQAKGKAIRKIILMDAEKAALFARLEEAGIWYMPLKGAVLKELYPAIGMRQMSDFDILFDANRADDLPGIMESIGFTVDHIGSGHHDAYEKEPVCRFEMHRMLFSTFYDEKLYRYYQAVKSRLLKDEDNEFGYHFSDEDFYIYMIAHEYKHFSGSGTGLRSVLDTYVFLRKNVALDWGYIACEMEKLGLSDFEAKNRSLSMHLFGGEARSAEEQAMLDYILSSGTYGTVQNRFHNIIAAYGGGKRGKLRYMLDRFCVPCRETDPNYAAYAGQYPVFYRHKLLLPVLPFYRIFYSVKSGRFKSEARAIKNARG